MQAFLDLYELLYQPALKLCEIKKTRCVKTYRDDDGIVHRMEKVLLSGLVKIGAKS